jgi:Carboxypeptidase regulatory-like domain
MPAVGSSNRVFHLNKIQVGGDPMFRKSCFFLVLFIVIACFSPHSLGAQQVAVAEVTGLVTDSTGAAVPGATVKMIETSKGVAYTVTTNSGGNYLLPGLPPGPYRLEASKVGFKTYVLSNIELQVNDHITLNVTLEVGSASEIVRVEAAAALVQTENASVSTVVDSQRIAELPLNGRYVTQLVLISGASMSAPGGDEVGSKNFYSSVTISVAGGQANGTNYLLEGGDNNDSFSNVKSALSVPGRTTGIQRRDEFLAGEKRPASWRGRKSGYKIWH